LFWPTFSTCSEFFSMPSTWNKVFPTPIVHMSEITPRWLATPNPEIKLAGQFRCNLQYLRFYSLRWDIRVKSSSEKMIFINIKLYLLDVKRHCHRQISPTHVKTHKLLQVMYANKLLQICSQAVNNLWSHCLFPVVVTSLEQAVNNL
jgi:hypothetical protein